MTKKELAKAYEISTTTLGKYLNTGILYQKLLQIDYQKRCKKLTPKQIHIIFEHLGRP